MIILNIGYFSTSAKFRGNIKILQLGLKFCDTWKNCKP